jgi:hypothetical protein
MEKLDYMNPDSQYATSLLYANTAGTVLAMAESIFPSTFILTGKGRAITDNTLKRLLTPNGITDLTRLTKKDVINSALYSIYREGLKEVPEELASLSVEKLTNHISNNLLGEDVFDDEIRADEVFKTAAFSALGMWAIGAPRGIYEVATAKKKVHPTQLLLEYDAAVNKSDMLRRIDKAVDSGRLSKEDSQAMKSRLEILDKNLQRATVAGAKSESDAAVMMHLLSNNEELKDAIKQLDETNIVDAEQKEKLTKRLNQSQQALEDIFRNGKSAAQVFKDYSTNQYSGVIEKPEGKKDDSEPKKEEQVEEEVKPKEFTPKEKFIRDSMGLDGVDYDWVKERLETDTELSQEDKDDILTMIETEEGKEFFFDESMRLIETGKEIDPNELDTATGLRQGETPTPERLAELYIEHTSGEDYIGELIREYSIRRQDFIHYGDKNLIGQAIGRFWLTRKGRDGMPLDVIAQEISERAGQYVSEQDIIDYILSNPYKAKYQKVSKEARAVATMYENLTGKSLNRETAQKVVEKARDSSDKASKKDDKVINTLRKWTDDNTGVIDFEGLFEYINDENKYAVERDWMETPIEVLDMIKDKVGTEEGRKELQRIWDDSIGIYEDESMQTDYQKEVLKRKNEAEPITETEVEESVDFSELPLLPQRPKTVTAKNTKEIRQIAASMMKDKTSSQSTRRMAKWLPRIFQSLRSSMTFHYDADNFNKQFEKRAGKAIEKDGVVYAFADGDEIHVNMNAANPNLLTSLIHEGIHTVLSSPDKVKKLATELRTLLGSSNPELLAELDDFASQYDDTDRDIEFLTEGVARIVAGKFPDKMNILQKIADFINNLLGKLKTTKLYEANDIESVIKGIHKSFKSGTIITTDTPVQKVREQKFRERMEAQGHKWAKKKEKTPEQVAREYTNEWFVDRKWWLKKMGGDLSKLPHHYKMSENEVYQSYLDSLKPKVRPQKAKKTSTTLDTITPQEYNQAIINAQVKLQEGHGYDAVVKGLILHYGFTPSLAKMIATQGMMDTDMTVGEAVQLFWKNGLSISHVKHIAKERGWKEKQVGKMFRDTAKGFQTYLNTRQDMLDYGAKILTDKTTKAEFVKDVMNRYGLSKKEADELFKIAFKTVFQSGTWNNLSKNSAVKKMVNQRAKVTKERNKESAEKQRRKNEVKKKMKGIRKAMGSKTTRVFAEQKPILRDILKINPKYLDEKTFNEVFAPLIDKISAMVQGAKVKFDNDNEIFFVDNAGQEGMITNAEMESVLKVVQEVVQANYRDMLVLKYGDKIQFDPTDTLEQVQDKIRKYNEENALSDDEKDEIDIEKRTALLNEAMQVIEEYKQAEQDGDLDGLDDNEKALINEILNSSPDILSDRDIIELINTLNNAVANQNVDYAGALVETIRAAQTIEWLDKQSTHQIEGVLGKIKNVYFSTSQMMEAIMNSTTLGAKFAALSGVQEIHAGYGRSRRFIHSAWVKPLAKILKGNPELRSVENVIARGIIAYIIQHNGDANSDFRKRAEVLMNDAIAKQESKKKALIKEGEIIQKFLEKYVEPALATDNPSQAFIERVSSEQSGNWEIVQLGINTAAQFKGNLDKTLRAYDNKMLAAWDNYTPTATKTITKEASFDDVSYGEPGLDTKQAGTTIDRVKFMKMRKGRGLDLDFDSVVERKMMDSMYYIETIGARQRAEKIFNNSVFIDKTGEYASNVLLNKLIDSIKQHRNMMTGDGNEVIKEFTNVTKRIRDIGAVNALGSVLQFVVQVPSVYVRAAINLAFNPKVQFYYRQIPSNMPDSFYSKGTILERKSMEAGTKSDPVNQTIKKTASQSESAFMKFFDFITKNQATKGAGKVIDKSKELALWTLQNSDYWIAKKTWGAYYTKFLVEEKGIPLGEIDWDTQAKNPDSEASAYADQQIDRTQNISDFTKGSFLVQRGKNAWKDMFMNTVAPFSSFSFNARGTAMLNIQKLRRHHVNSKEWGEAMADMMGYFAEAVVFTGIKIIMLGALSKAIAESFVRAVVDDEDEELLEKMFKDKDVKEQAVQSLIQAYLDTAVGGFGSLIEGKARHGVNLVAGMIDEDYENKDLLPIYENETALGQLAFLFGSGSVVIENVANAAPYIEQFITGETDFVVKAPYKNEPAIIERVKLTEEERRIAGIIALDALARSFGITDSKAWTPAIRGLIRYQNNVMSKKYGDTDYTIETMRKGKKKESKSGGGRSYKRSVTTRSISTRSTSRRKVERNR